LEAVAEDEAVGPVNVVTVELDFLLVRELGVSEQFALGVLAHGRTDDGLGADALMNVQRDGVHLEETTVVLLFLGRPLQPRLLIAERLVQKSALGIGKVSPPI
jgi:hypothetical protein